MHTNRATYDFLRPPMTDNTITFERDKARSGISVRVFAADDLALQTVSLGDVIREAQHVATELLATMIATADVAKLSIQDYCDRGSKLLRELVELREPNLVGRVSVEASTKYTEDQQFLIITFNCNYWPLISATIAANDGVRFQVH